MLLVRPKLKQCATENNVTDSELTAIIANDLTNQGPNVQCLSLCFLNKLNMFELDGTINVITSKILFSFGENPFFVSHVVDKCKVLTGSNPCETASLVYACYCSNVTLTKDTTLMY